MRTKNQIHVLGGHTNTVGALLTQSTDPQVITAGMDSQVKVRVGQAAGVVLLLRAQPVLRAACGALLAPRPRCAVVGAVAPQAPHARRATLPPPRAAVALRSACSCGTWLPASA
jgi:hypothetical protein